MTGATFRVLVLGGTGVFGRRICRRLACEPGVSILLASRSVAKADAMVARLRAERAAGELQGIELDGLPGALDRTLAERPTDLVIHAAGPFQGQNYAVAECCIRRGVHYLDLADGRDFVCGFARLDHAARAAGVVAVSGTSSVPGLSSAVVDHLIDDRAVVERIAIGITPGNRARFGRAAVAGILSYAGRPIGQWREGRWLQVYGLQDLRRRRLQVPGRAPLGARLVAACDVPDLALFPTRYAPAKTVSFHAGLELSALMLCLWGLSWLVRFGLIASLAPLAAVAQSVSGALRHFGSDRGAMFVELVAITEAGRRVRRTWTLIAERNHGPYVPCLPVVILTRHLASGRLATPARGHVLGSSLSRISPKRRATWQLPWRGRTPMTDLSTPLYRRVLGPEFDRLPGKIRSLHEVTGPITAAGLCQIQRGDHPLARALGRAFGLPPSGRDVPISVTFKPSGDGETWQRHFNGIGLRSHQSAARRPGHLVERFGHLNLLLEPRARCDGLDLLLCRVTLLGIPVPRRLWPLVEASERVFEGIFTFDVAIRLPVAGLLIHYKGWLRPPA